MKLTCGARLLAHHRCDCTDRIRFLLAVISNNDAGVWILGTTLSKLFWRLGCILDRNSPFSTFSLMSDRWRQLNKRPDAELLSSTEHRKYKEGEEECGIPHQNLFPVFYACLTINHDHNALFDGFYSSAQSLEQITGKIRPCDWKGML